MVKLGEEDPINENSTPTRAEEIGTPLTWVKNQKAISTLNY